MKNIKNLNELVSYYNNKADWTPAEVKDFVKIKNDFYDKDWEKFEDEIAGFDDEGYGEWTLESRTCDSWGGLDSEIEKIFNNRSIDSLSNDFLIDFLHPINDDNVCFSYEKLEKYLKNNGYRITNDYRIVKAN